MPHWIPRQYIETFFSTHGTDRFLQLGTTVEDVSKSKDDEGWKITLRKHDAFRNVDEWWSEKFDAVVIANGHYSVPYVRWPLCIAEQSLQSVDPRSSWTRPIHQGVPRPDPAFENIQKIIRLWSAENRRRGQFGLRTRRDGLTHRFRRLASLSIPPFGLPLGRQIPCRRNRVEARDFRIPS